MYFLQPVMTGLPITEVVHSRTVAGRSLPTISLSSLGNSPRVTTGLVHEPLMAAVNLSTKYPSSFSGIIPAEITATKIDSGLDVMSVSPVAGEILSNFPTNPNSQKITGTTVNPLLMNIPTHDSMGLNMRFPPTQHLLQTSMSIPTQTVETSGLMQAGSPLTGITSLNPDNVTIRITTVPTESTDQGTACS